MIKNKKNKHLNKEKQEKISQELTFEEMNRIMVQMSVGTGIQFFGVTPYGFWY